MAVARKRRAVSLVALAALVLVAGGSSLGKPLPGANDPFAFHFKNAGAGDADRVDQQSPNWPNTDPSTWVTNPTECAWDVDDVVQYAGYGRVLDAGAVVSQSSCLIADGGTFAGSVVGHLYVINATSASPHLLVSVSVGSDGAVAVPVPAAGGGYSYRACVVPSIETSPGTVIPGSNGGVGVRREVLWRVESRHPRSLRDVVADARLVIHNSLSRAEYCP